MQSLARTVREGVFDLKRVASRKHVKTKLAALKSVWRVGPLKWNEDRKFEPNRQRDK